MLVARAGEITDRAARQARFTWGFKFAMAVIDFCNLCLPWPRSPMIHIHVARVEVFVLLYQCISAAKTDDLFLMQFTCYISERGREGGRERERERERERVLSCIDCGEQQNILYAL